MLFFQVLLSTAVLTSIFLVTHDDVRGGCAWGVGSCIIGTIYFAMTNQWPLIAVEVVAFILYLKGLWK